MRLFRDQRRLAGHHRAVRLWIHIGSVGRNSLPDRLEASAVDPEPDHLFVKGAPWNLETLQHRRDIAAGLQQTLPAPGALEVLKLVCQRKCSAVSQLVVKATMG